MRVDLLMCDESKLMKANCIGVGFRSGTETTSAQDTFQPIH